MGAIAVVALSLIVRVAWVLLVPTKPVGDFAMYMESAAHLVSHGELDSGFVFMPGYVGLLAAVQALGGGLLACKMVGAVSGAVAVGAVYGITRHLWGGGTAVVAGLLCALWPAGVAVASVTGTDMPAAALIALAVYGLVRWGEDRPRRAVLVFGVMMGLAAYVRAVAMPLALLSIFYFRALSGSSWWAAAKRGLIGLAVGLLVLSPWIVRNKLHEGEWFVTDSHGGHTALVGANPNSEGAYSRSLNVFFSQITGFTLLTPPHSASDRAAYTLARQWFGVQPAYSAGLAVLKAERLLDNERDLLYWPLFRAGVLRDPQRAWFAAHRAELERVTDVFWWALAAASVGGLALAAARRRWLALSLLPFQLALVALYALYFAEVRYQMPIALLMFPSAGGAITWLFAGAASAWQKRIALRELGREAWIAVVCVVMVFGGWAVAVRLGAHLRHKFRWAVHSCQIGNRTAACAWRVVWSRGRDPVAGWARGVYDGVGLAVPTSDATVVAETEISLPPGRYIVRAEIDGPLVDPALATATEAAVEIALRGRETLARFDLSAIVAAGWKHGTVPVRINFTHGGGALGLQMKIIGRWVSPDITGELRQSPARVWLTGLEVRKR